MPRSVPVNAEPPARELDVRNRSFQGFGRRLLAFLDHAGCRHQDRLAFGIQAARPAGAAASRDSVGVALPDADLVAVHAELVHGELDIGRLMSLACALRSRRNTSTKPSSAKRISARSLGEPPVASKVVSHADAAFHPACLR